MSLSFINYNEMMDWFCPLSYGDREIGNVMTALNTAAKNPKAVCRLSRTEHQYQLIRSLVGARMERKCNLWPHLMKQQFPNLFNHKNHRELWSKTLIPRSRTKLLNLQEQMPGNWHFNDCITVTGILFVNSFLSPQFIDWPPRSHLMTSLSLSSTDLPRLYSILFSLCVWWGVGGGICCTYLKLLFSTSLGTSPDFSGLEGIKRKNNNGYLQFIFFSHVITILVFL